MSWIVSATLFASACGEDPPERETPSPVEVVATVERSTLIVDADRRIVSDAMRTGLTDADPSIRLRAVQSVAAMHGAAHYALLRAAIRDTDPEVRAAGSLGIGALGDEAPDRAVSDLVGAITSETDETARGAMIRDLGRLPDRRVVRVIESALRSETDADRAAACLGIAERGLASRPVPATAVSRMAALLAASEPDEVRLACAFAIGRVAPPTDAGGAQSVLVGLALAAADADPEVRALVIRALGRQAGANIELLATAVRDPDWRVSVQALRALSSQVARTEDGPRILAVALRYAATQLVADGEVRAGGPVHVFLAAIAAAAPVARQGGVYELANELHSRFGEGAPSRDRALVHCASAELMDRGRGWPSRVTECGGDLVTEVERQILEARILGELDGAIPQRLGRLRRLFSRETPAVCEAVLEAATKILAPEATELVLQGIAVDDAGVRAAALSAIGTIASRRPTADVIPPPLPVEETVAALETARTQTPDDELETWVTWLDALDAVDARDASEHVVALASHSNHGVRHRALRLLRTWAIDAPETELSPPDNPLSPTEVPPSADRPRVRLTTSRGDMVLELRPDVAPTTVARFLSLVEAGFFTEMRFHRVVGAFVIQGGDPRGDGYGGPGWSQRCEDHRLPYRRGTVGMALAGRDTGGSQFFITHGAQPHLELRYTAFAEVVEGLDIVDAIQAGDAIIGVTQLDD